MEPKVIEWDQVQNVKFFQSLLDNWRTGFLCDCAVEAEGQLIKGHKIILASASQYFNVSS